MGWGSTAGVGPPTEVVIAGLTRNPCAAGLGQWNMSNGSRIKSGMTAGVGPTDGMGLSGVRNDKAT